MSDSARILRRSAILGVVTLMVLVCVVFPVVFWGARKSADNFDLAAGQKQQNAISACRATLRADIDDAAFAVSTAQAELELVTNRALEAVLRGDETTLAALAPQVEPIRAELNDALVRQQVANEAYRRAADESAKDPARFAATCQ